MSNDVISFCKENIPHSSCFYFWNKMMTWRNVVTRQCHEDIKILRFWKKTEGLSSHKTQKLSSKGTFCAVFWFVFEDFRKDIEEYRSVWNCVEWKRISKTNPKLTIFSTNFVRNPHRQITKMINFVLYKHENNDFVLFLKSITTGFLNARVNVLFNTTFGRLCFWQK